MDDRQQGLPLTARLQEDELQKDILQIFQVGHAFLSLLVSLETTHFALQQLAGGKCRENRVIQANIVSFQKTLKGCCRLKLIHSKYALL